MVNVKKSMRVLKHFILILTLLVTSTNCFAQLTITKIEGKEINISDKAAPVEADKYDGVIAPYRDRIKKDLDNVLAYAPATLEKSTGQWQSPLGDLLANVTLAKTNPIFRQREAKNIDLCILNHGGIRAPLNKGDVTTRSAFEIMPFENTTVVVAITGDKILEFTKYFVKEKKPHPVAGITFTISANNEVSDIRIKGQPLNLTKVYYVVTSDYLSSGGDNMTFFSNPVKIYDLEYKLRNVFIDYFKDVDTVTAPTEIKITQEK